jgi:predicted MPP superfamily phosphohydrolase
MCVYSGPTKAFDGFTILRLNADMSDPALKRVDELTRGLGGTWSAPSMWCSENHDSIAMVPDLEAHGIRVLLNERVAIARDETSINLAGVDDAHFYRADNIEQAAAEIPEGSVKILLSHTPEIYRQAAHVDA